MNELNYQLDLLKAMNQKLTEKERMYAKVCESVMDAFLYYSHEKNYIATLGPWKDYFDFEIKDVKDFSRLFDIVDEQYVLPLREVLYLEKTGEDMSSTECQLKERKNWLQFRTSLTRLLTISGRFWSTFSNHFNIS